jgi:RNA polymerase sigma factor (TIGR02999 family)
MSQQAAPEVAGDSSLAPEQHGALSHQQLFRTLYGELHRLAQRQLARQQARRALGTTTLLHETYLSLSHGRDRSFPDEAHFMGYAARTMRGLIIDFARRRRTQKRGHGFDITSLDESTPAPVDDRQLLQIGAAVDELATLHPELAQLVDLKFFCGFSFEAIAAMRGVCKRTTQREWERARLQLHELMSATPPSR